VCVMADFPSGRVRLFSVFGVFPIYLGRFALRKREPRKAGTTRKGDT